ncbi:MAG TPA: hypothetical protein VFD38_18200, partial [Myxococcaceae bacterium]|nr:hypothetical protein [Myxococcaceae bacterium]
MVDRPAWRVRSPSGRVIAFRELTSMQKWIVERKFGRDDEISLHGDHWKRLGDIAELQPFFLLLDEVDRVHQLEERLRRAELPDEAPAALERELGGVAPEARPAPIGPSPTPIRLETPIEPGPEPEAVPEGVASGPRAGLAPAEPVARAEAVTWPTSAPTASAGGAAQPARTGTPSAFSLEDIREATRPSPDDLPMPEGTVEPPPPPPGDDADQPQFTRRAGLGVEPGAVDDTDGWDTPPRRSKAPWVATILLLAAAAVAVAAYFQVWVPAQEEKLRQEAQRARLEESQKARDAADAEGQERERRAKEELVAGMAGKADAGTGTTVTPPAVVVDAGTGGSASPEGPRGSLESPEPPPSAASTRAVAA